MKVDLHKKLGIFRWVNTYDLFEDMIEDVGGKGCDFLVMQELPIILTETYRPILNIWNRGPRLDTDCPVMGPMISICQGLKYKRIKL